MGPAGDGLIPAGWPRSPYVHSGYLQAFADGGLLFGLPVLLLCLAVASGLVRRLVRASRRPGEADDIAAVAAVAALALMAHSALDFDWSYPALLSMTGVVIALGLARQDPAPAAVDGPAQRGRLGAPVVGALYLALCLFAVVAARSSDAAVHALDQRHRAPTPAAQAAALMAADGALSGYRLDASILDMTALAAATGGPEVAVATVEHALRATSEAASVDRRLGLRRAWAMLVLGRPGQAAVTARQVLASVGPAHGQYAADVARVLSATGDTDGARRLLMAEIGPELAVPGDVPGLWTHVAALLQVSAVPDDLARCVYAAAVRRKPAPAGVGAGYLTEAPTGVDCAAVLARAEGAR